MKPGISIEAAQADLAAAAESLAREFPQTNKGRGVALERMHDSIVGSDLRLTSMLFLGVVGFVLLICCANVANLLLARATVRVRELAVRSALGAGRRRIIRQLLTESLVLSLLGGALGIAVGAAILSAAPSLIPQGLLPATVTLAFDMRVVAFCAGTALLVGLLFGVMPAWKATEFSSAAVIASDSRTTTGGGGRLRGLLVIGEVATAVLLLCGAGLLLRTLLAVEGFDRGYRAESVLTMLVDPLGSKYPTDDALQQFFDQVEAEIAAVPGVAGVAWASALPLDFFESGGFSFEIVGDAPVDANQRPGTEYQVVSPKYFSTLELPILSGRAFDERDRRDGVPVCIVNEAFARHFQGRSPIGQRVALRPTSSPEADPVVREIVGVARQVKGRPDETTDFVQLYVPMAQDLSDDIFLAVRPKAGRAEALAAAVREALSRVDKEQLVSVRSVMTLEDIAWVSHRPSSLPRRDGRRLCGPGAGACDGRRVWNPRVFGSAAHARLRRAQGARRDEQRRRSTRDCERGSRRRDWRGDWTRAVGRVRPPHREDAVRRATAGSDDIRGGDDTAGDHGRAVDRGTGMACRTNRPGRRPAEYMSRPAAQAIGTSFGAIVVSSDERSRPLRTQASTRPSRGPDPRRAAGRQTQSDGRVHGRGSSLRRRCLPQDRPAAWLPHHESRGRSSCPAGQRAQLPQEPALRQAADVDRQRPVDERG